MAVVESRTADELPKMAVTADPSSTHLLNTEFRADSVRLPCGAPVYEDEKSHPQMPSQKTSAQTATLGGWDLSISVILFLQGVLCGQFAYYTNVNKRDSVWLKLFVTGLALLTTLKTIQVLVFMWVQNVTLFHNLEAASILWATYWVPELSPVFESVTVIYVQSFFCRRLWKISRNAYIVVACMTSFTFALVSGGVGAFFILTDVSSSKTRTWMSPHLGAVVCGDLLLTGSTVFYLLRHSRTVLPRGPTAPILSSLRRVTIQSAAPPALCALINFVSGMLINMQLANTPVSTIITSNSNMVLPQLYVWAAMWTLNSREDIFTADNNHCTLRPDLRGTFDSETVGNPVVHAGGGNELIHLQWGGRINQSRLVQTESLRQSLRPDGVCRLV
ncbi:hypothetical protein B0H19DRAFT_1268489 [Mycena capillaripes]|nr:hypothetical protein B0H19DRAFT_1268489 [Mycena capillaripes]